MKQPFYIKLLAARAVDYTFWLLILSLIEDQTSLYVPPFLLLILAPILMIVFGGLICFKSGTTIGLKLLGLGFDMPVSLKEAFLSTIPFVQSKKIKEKKSVSFWRYALAIAIGVSSLVVQFNDPVYGFNRQGKIENSSWVQYTEKQAGFSVYFPDEPDEAKKPLTPDGETGLNYTEMSAKEKKGNYSLSFLKLPKKWGLAGQNTILKVAMDLIVKNTVNAKLISKQTFEYNGLKGIEYVMSCEGKEVKGRLLIHQNTLYKLNVEYPDGASEKVSADEFFGSFAIEK